jgi:hypothetical protein
MPYFHLYSLSQCPFADLLTCVNRKHGLANNAVLLFRARHVLCLSNLWSRCSVRAVLDLDITTFVCIKEKDTVLGLLYELLVMIS